MHLEGHYIGFPEFLRSFLSFSGGWVKDLLLGRLVVKGSTSRLSFSKSFQSCDCSIHLFLVPPFLFLKTLSSTITSPMWR